jgi:hypothetical protein
MSALCLSFTSNSHACLSWGSQQLINQKLAMLEVWESFNHRQVSYEEQILTFERTTGAILKRLREAY